VNPRIRNASLAAMRALARLRDRIRPAASAALASLRGGLDRRSVGARMALLVGAGVLFILGSTTLIVAWQAGGSLNRQATSELVTAVDVGERMLDVYDRNLGEATQRLYDTFLAFLPEYDIEVGDEGAVVIGEHEAPALYMGETLLNGNYDAVDRFTMATEGVATVFARTGDDFIRVTTSLRREDGLRAEGTLLARDHPAYPLMLEGRDYTGPAVLFGRDYITHYGPITDWEGNTTAIFFIGMPYGESLQALKDTMRETRIGQAGHFFAIDASGGRNHGELTVHPFLEGRRIEDLDDADGGAMLQRILAEGPGTYRLRARLAADGRAEDLVAVVDAFEPWGWLVVGVESRSALNAASWRLFTVMGLLGLVALAILVGGLMWLSRQLITRPLGEAVEAVSEVADGNLDVQLSMDRHDEIGTLYHSLQRMVDEIRGRIEADRRVAGENLRIRRALDASSTCVMIADTDRRIIYANAAVLDMLRAESAELRTQLPDFDVDAVIGGSIDQFHANPAHQRDLLSGLTGTHRARIRVGDAHFSLAASPVDDDDGERVGYVVEWVDRTAEVGVEREVGEIIEAASVGVLDRRVALEGKQGFHLVLADGVNSLLDTQQASVNAVQEVLSAMARGDLTRTIDADFQGAFGEIKRDANRTVEQLRRIVAGIQRSAEAINVAAGEIAAGNNDLSRRTESQAASLEETASSMEELTATVRQNAEHAREARGLAGGASQAAERGGSVVGEVVQTMAGISESSKRIGDIIGVIDGIAFQTNILALNAAVEAARAGEQGRGFAVVASEVRSLAQRSADAAREIKQLISESTRRVGEGSQLVDQAGAAMGEIVEQVHRVSGIIAEIAAASDEQAAGIEQVNGTVTQMDEVTQQNAALVEEASASARALEEQAGGLAEAVAIFRLEATATAR